MLSYEIALLGPWEFRASTGEVTIPAGRLRVLLASLVLSANQTVSVDVLAEQVWPERPPMRARGSMHTYVGRLRKLLGPGVIHTRPGGGYQLTIAPDRVDVHRFRSLLTRAAQAPSPAEELASLNAALELWRGTPFADLYSTWLDRDVAPRLVEEWLAATGRRLELELDVGCPPERLIAELRELTDQYPAQEALWALLVAALHRAGRRAEALEAYRRVRVVLREELGIEPGEALARLHREVLLDGHTAPGKEAPVVPTCSAGPRQLPHDITRFTGRDEELAGLDSLLPDESAQAPTIISLDGPAGVGKTALAVHWAHRRAHRYPDAQLYLNLRGYGPGDPVTPEAATETMLRALGVASELIPGDLDERSALLRSTLSGHRALILLDNARDADQVRPLLPGVGGLVVVTSRNQLRGLSIQDGAHRVTVRRLPGADSVRLLAAAVGPDRVDEDPTAASVVVKQCDHLPLALVIVAERAQRAGSLAEVVAALEDEQARLDTLDAGEDNSLRAALAWSYRALGPGAAAMFRRLGLHPANDIGLDAAATLADVPVATAQAALDHLVAAHLVEQRQHRRYELHDLVRLYAAEIAEQECRTDRDTTIRRVLDWYLYAATNADRALNPHRRREFLEPYGPPERQVPEFAERSASTRWFEREFDCLRSVACWAARNGLAGYAWRIAITMTTFFDYRIPWPDGVQFYGAHHAAARASGERKGEGYTLNSLGCIHFDQGSAELSRTYFQRAHAVFEEVGHRFGQAMTTGNLSMVHGQLGQTELARQYAAETLRLYEDLDYRRGPAMALDNLGMAHAAAGEYERAVECFQRAVDLLRDLDDPQTEAFTLLNLGKAYARLADHPRAVRAFRQSIVLHRTLGNARWEATVLADLGEVLVDAGHPEHARVVLGAALATLTEFGDPRAEQVQDGLAAL
ncbi:AfsR/SARP family transcriptional regulator [Actinophytocola xanthii]|uniref:OmpR/PhoB-type domain-containing protein n=1 Tax=Actinophytocola xanthii TaxID=1912961 RepID=A0A1Q8CKV6_9PSEU|nr:AfsR/SARP family transcriptional regulator [Actinophytocola xanthii]OLF14985.1 hypothetical protein BU204_24055 [Actinophytocola xanthii]